MKTGNICSTIRWSSSKHQMLGNPSKGWTASYICLILSNKSVLGYCSHVDPPVPGISGEFRHARPAKAPATHFFCHGWSLLYTRLSGNEPAVIPLV